MNYIKVPTQIFYIPIFGIFLLVHSTECTGDGTQNTVHNTQYLVHSTQYRVQSAQCNFIKWRSVSKTFSGKFQWYANNVDAPSTQ